METLEPEAEARTAPQEKPAIEEWLAGWPAIRGDALALLDEFRRVRPEYDPHWMEWVIGEMDDAVTNLDHRTKWLRRHIVEPPTLD